ncbi:MAG: tetratricopeptide repeat-containing sensor histidine kinase [Bacteroidetes bacterium]|nr:tetratricopeptide repeat-containing sensor histidine kinase [Bacteroidota bacterium]
MGVCYWAKGDYPKALEYYYESLVIYQEMHDRSGVARALGNIGIVYQNQGNLPKALEYNFRALQVFEEQRDKRRIAKTLSNIGTVYEKQNDYSLALKYDFKSLKISEELKDKYNIAINLGNIGNVYASQKDYASALVYDNKALKLFEELGNKNGIAISLGNLGDVSQSENEYPQALSFYYKALKISEELGDKSSIARNLGNIGGVYVKVVKNKPSAEFPDSLKNAKTSLAKALMYLGKAIVLEKEIGELGSLQGFYQSLSEAQEFSGNYKEALAYKNLAYSIKDSMFSMDNSKRIEILENQRKEDIKQKEIEIQKLQLESARNQKWYFIAGVMFLILLLVLLYNRFRFKQKSSDELEVAYHILKSTQQQLVQQEKLASLGQITAGIAHEIQNPLNFVNNFSDITKELIKDYKTIESETERQEVVDIIDKNLDKIIRHGKRADQIVKSMLMHTQNNAGEKKAININALCNELAEVAYSNATANDADFKCEVIKYFDNSVDKIDVIPQDITRVVLNLLNNALYAVKGKHDATVTISTDVDIDMFEIRIKDNGGGIPEAIRAKIFEPFFTTKPTNEGTGLGLSLSYDIVLAHHGDIKLESKEGIGSEFIIRLPL